MIKIENLCKSFGKVNAVKNLSLTIKHGTTFALLGLNGAGKTTTINILCTTLKKDSGKVFVSGYDLDKNEREIKPLLNLSPQETAVAQNLTVEENLNLIAGLYSIENTKEKVAETIERFSLNSKRTALAKTLSGGQKRRLSLAMSVITNPKLLILDEPTLGLDIKSRKELWKIISELKGKTTILLTTHYLEEAVSLADTIGLMKKGELVAFGSAKEIVESSGKADFESAFLALCGGEDE